MTEISSATPSRVSTFSTLPLVVALLLVSTVSNAESVADSVNDELEEDSDIGIAFGERVFLETELEFEFYKERLTFKDERDRTTSRGTDGSLQLGLSVGFVEEISANLGLTVDFDDSDIYFDEWTLRWEPEFSREFSPAMSIGLQELPFAQSDTRLISDPLSDFASIDARAFLLELPVTETVTVFGGAFRGKASEVGSGSANTDWVAGLTGTVGENVEYSVAWLSDLADADSSLLEEWDDRYATKVAAFSAQLGWSVDEMELSIDTALATRRFDELDERFAKPRAWGMELTWHFRKYIDLTVRVDQARALIEEPRSRYAIGATWRFHPNATLGFELMRENYSADTAFYDDGEISRSNRANVALSVRF